MSIPIAADGLKGIIYWYGDIFMWCFGMEITIRKSVDNLFNIEIILKSVFDKPNG